MYKIYRITNYGAGWYSGGLPHFFYIAKSKEEVVANSKRYKEWTERSGDVGVHEVSGLVAEFLFENLSDFDITVSVQHK